MEPMHGVNDAIRIQRTPSDQRRNRRGGGRDFEQEFERETAEEESGHAPGRPVEKRDNPVRKRLQPEPVVRRKNPSDGEFHIDVLA